MAFSLPLAADYDATWNQRRVEQITRYVYSLKNAQYNEWKKARGEQGNNNNDDKTKPPEVFRLDPVAITEKVASVFRANILDSQVIPPRKTPLVDIRSKVEVKDAARAEAEKKFPRKSSEELQKLEEEYAAERYPLYKEGDVVEVTYAYGKAPAKTYRGTFKRISPFRLMIGKNFLNYKDLPEEIAARFDAEKNEELRKKMIARHPVTSKYNIEREEEADKIAKAILEKQFKQNLRRGWIYIDGGWTIPAELVGSILKFSEAEKRLAREAYYKSQQKTTAIVGGSSN